MRINRDSFNDNFTTYNIPDWTCSSCKKGKLFFDEKNIKVFETNLSKREREENDWEPYWIKQHFIGTITCNNPKCKEIFTIAGNVNIEEDYDEEHEQIFTSCYYPKYFFPTLNIFKIPEDISLDVLYAINSAFKVFWIDKSACANAIRTVIEVIINDKGVLKTKLTNNKKRRSLSLHERIELFEKKNSEVANYLMAIKWIGNAGSHDEEITNDDILDGLDILKYSLKKLYTTHDKEISQITKQINKRRKP